MKRRFCITALLVALFAFVAASAYANPVTGVRLNGAEFIIDEGEMLVLSATVEPADAANKDLIWQMAGDTLEIWTIQRGENRYVSRDEEIVLFAKQAGTVNVQVSTVDGGFSALCSVKVMEAPRVKVEDLVMLDLANPNVVVEGDIVEFGVSYLPSGAKDKRIIWKAAYEDGTRIDLMWPRGRNSKAGSVGVLGPEFFVRPGRTQENIVLTPETVKGEVSTTWNIVLTRTPIADPIIPLKSVNLSDETLFMEPKKEYTLKAKTVPENATNRKVVWTSSDESVVKVEDGVVTSVAPGKAYITASVEDRGMTESATCAITVLGDDPKKVSGIRLSESTLKLAVGAEHRLTAEVMPSTAEDKRTDWLTSDAGIATVTDGLVKTLSPGLVTITAVTRDGGYSASCAVESTSGGGGGGSGGGCNAVFAAPAMILLGIPLLLLRK